jgi:uncharacterized membrane protein (UPF0127 family)
LVGTELTVTRRDGVVVCEECLVAATPFARMRGLLGRRSLPSGQGILLRPAASVHTFFMRFSIDVVFLDDELRVVGIASDLPPWRAAGKRGARAVLELPAGECARRGLQVGDTVRFA